VLVLRLVIRNIYGSAFNQGARFIGVSTLLCSPLFKSERFVLLCCILVFDLSLD
jgi:hypothetical protein